MLVAGAQLLALGGVMGLGFALGTGAGWHGALARGPAGWAVWAALAAASPAVLWSYYGYPDLAKIAEEVVDPSRTLPRLFLGGLAITAALSPPLNAGFPRVRPLDPTAATTLWSAHGRGPQPGAE